MKPIFLLALLFFCNPCLFAQAGKANLVKYDKPLSLNLADNLTDLDDFGLTAGHTLRKQYEQTGPTGQQHVKYKQYYQGKSVLNGTLIFHLNPAGQVISTSGQLARFTDLELKPGFPSVAAEKRALEVVLSQQKATTGIHLTYQDLEVTSTTGVIASQAYPKLGGGYVPAYLHTVKATDASLPVSMNVVINARNGQVIAAISNIHTETVVGTGQGLQNENVSFNVDSVAANRYEMRDLTRGLGVWAYDLLYQRTPVDEDNSWDDPAEAAGAMVDGYYASLRFYDFLLEKFGRNSIDDAGAPLISNFNRNNYVNAFWNGESATYGNGDCDRYGPLTTLDVVGHEFAHGLTQYTSGLIYQDESGALNESISDILGKALEYDVAPDNFDWRIGSAFRRNSSVNFFRSMNNPSQRNHPKFYLGNNWRTGPGDAGGVHSNSGVFNFWFYLLVEGGLSVNEAGQRYDVDPIGWEAALNLVYLLETAYLIESSGYPEAYTLALEAASELFGVESTTYASVIEAWKAVGLPRTPDDGGGDGAIPLNFFANLNNPGSSFDFRFCPDELENLSISYFNDSDATIASGATVSGQVVFSYFGAEGPVEDTVILEERFLAADLSLGDQLEFPSPFIAPPGVDFVSVTSDLTFRESETLSYTIATNGFIFINVLEEVVLNFSAADYSEVCGDDQFLFDDFYSIALPRCTGGTEGSIRLIFESPDAAVFLDRPVDNPANASVAFFGAFDEANAASLGDLNRVTLRIVHLTEAGETTIYEESLASRFANGISTPTIIDFTDSLEAQYDLAIATGRAINAEYREEQLSLNNNNDFPFIPECVPLRDFGRMAILNEDATLTSVTLCVDGSNIEDPHLTFDLQFFDNTEFSAAENRYLHGLTVFTDSLELLTEPITTTEGEMRNFEVQLGEGFIGEVTLYATVSATSAILDNIGIRSGNSVSTRRLDPGAFGITYNNPVDDLLELRAAQALPAGTVATLYTGDGRMIRRIPVQHNQASIEVNQLVSGLYFLTVSDGQTFRWTGKVIRR